MQVTITLNHLIMLIFFGLMLGIVLYALHVYKKISKELSAITTKISPCRDRISSITKRIETIKGLQHKERR
jgi:hypothetical protein